jgi:hypothetical protein
MAKTPKTTKKKTVKKKAAAKKATTQKAAAKKTVKKAVKKKATSKATSGKKTAAKKSNKIKVTPEQRHKMICEAAYYISLDRTAETVNPTEDWLQAEAFIHKITTLNKK